MSGWSQTYQDRGPDYQVHCNLHRRCVSIPWHALVKAIRQLRTAAEQAGEDRPVTGCERPMVNEVLTSEHWTETRRWRWKRPGHINILESGVVKNWMTGVVATAQSSAPT